jgi:hypothetical protein
MLARVSSMKMESTVNVSMCDRTAERLICQVPGSIPSAKNETRMEAGTICSLRKISDVNIHGQRLGEQVSAGGL